MPEPRFSSASSSSSALPLVAMIVAVAAWGLGGILVKQVSVDGLTVAFYRLCLGSALTVGILETLSETFALIAAGLRVNHYRSASAVLASASLPRLRK